MDNYNNQQCITGKSCNKAEQCISTESCHGWRWLVVFFLAKVFILPLTEAFQIERHGVRSFKEGG